MEIAIEKTIKKVSKPIKKRIIKNNNKTVKTVQKRTLKNFTPADITLERQAEMMSPEEYISARQYLSSLEMNNMIF